jgi:nucleoside-diphosphate kinase
MAERTLSIIKPDATRRNLTGKVNARFEEKGLRIVAQRRLRLSRARPSSSMPCTSARPFFDSLCEFMTSGRSWCRCSKATTPCPEPRDHGCDRSRQATAGTIRKDFAESIEANSVHGSDSAENAAIEIAYFFSRLEQVG